MKYFKLFLLVAAIAFFGSCSDDKETQNTNSDVVVEMESPTFSAKESAGSVRYLSRLQERPMARCTSQWKLKSVAKILLRRTFTTT